MGVKSLSDIIQSEPKKISQLITLTQCLENNSKD